jgi:Ca2+-binding RTX toxin-like protein
VLAVAVEQPALVGGSGDDYLDGGPGPNFLCGRGGNDVLVAGSDATWNVLWGGAATTPCTAATATTC